MATIEDIIKVSGTSRSTVFRFLNGENVRTEAKNSIIKAMRELNYKTNAIHKQMNMAIEISISENFESFTGFSRIVDGITQRASEIEIPVYLSRRTGEQIDNDYSHWDLKKQTKGVIIVGKNIDDEEKESEILASKKIAHIFVNRMIEKPGISYVSADLKMAAYEIVDYLIKNGHRDIVVFGSPQNFRVDREKLEGYRMAFRDNDIKVSEIYYNELQNIDDWEICIKKMFEKDYKPTAFFGICDSYSIKFMHIAQSYGFRIPEDIAVVGMDDVDIASYVRPSLTTVHIPFKKMGLMAVDNLLQLMTENEFSSIKSIVKHQLIIRESSNKCIL